MLYEFHEGRNAKRILQSTCVVYRITAAEHRCVQCFSKFEKSSAIFSKPYSGKSNTLYRNHLKPYFVTDLQRDLTKRHNTSCSTMKKPDKQTKKKKANGICISREFAREYRA